MEITISYDSEEFFQKLHFFYLHHQITITYDSEELIEELERDIEEFGNIEMYAFVEEIGEREIITNYDFIVEEMPIKAEEVLEREKVIILQAKEILERLKRQREIKEVIEVV